MLTCRNTSRTGCDAGGVADGLDAKQETRLRQFFHVRPAFVFKATMAQVRVYLERLKQRLKVDLFREAGRQYPVFCFMLIFLLSSTVLLNRYLHILMVFWSFLAGVVTFYCSLSPETLLPNIFFPIKPKTKQEQPELFPLGHSCAVCGKRKCKRHKPTLLLENYQPWLNLKVHSKVDASLSEVLELVLENFVYPWYRDITDDEAFVDELRLTLRFSAAVMVRRVQKIDAPSDVLPTGKLLFQTARTGFCSLRNPQN
ncbi:hypothetical protein MATL_G00200910 [Megalops atlanticus]|uniref:PXA domain-containing protein n=1 Tax=Megalops atlanticus TaxID=7932 RepID=A0A9D3SXP9_MEGAT|nr:hypothetical protein MATL_G00200910 [Megalops atlanticus]